MTSTKFSPTPIKALSKIKPLLSLVFLVFSVGLGILVSVITLREDLGQFNWQAFLEASADWFERWPMMVIAFTLLIMVILTSGLRLHLLIKIKQPRQRFIDSLIYGILARYYVLITPWGLGGQPIVMGIMYKKNLPLGIATSAPMLDLLVMRFAMFIFVLIALIGYGYLVDPLIYLLAWIGFIFTCLIPVVMITASFHPFFSQLLIDVVTWVVPTKKRASFQAKLQETLTQYRQAFLLVKNHPSILILVILFALISQFSLLAIPYFVIASFNLSMFAPSEFAFNLMHVLMMMAFANTILGTVPTLGSAGAAEFTFSTVFSTFISGNILFWATFLWRFLLFYFWLMMGMMISLLNGIFYQREKRRHHLPNFNLPLKVFIFNDGFYPLIDGVVRAVDNYARFLLTQGVDVTVVVPTNIDTTPFPYPIIAIKQIKIPGFFYPLPSLAQLRKIKKSLYHDGPTIYHVHTPFLIGQFAIKLARAYNYPVVTTFHSKYRDDFYQLTHSHLLSYLLTKKIVQITNRSQEIWTVAKSTIATMQSYGIHIDKVKIFANGIHFLQQDLSDDDGKVIMRQYHLKEDVPIILFVGQLIWQKNIKFILDTYAGLEKKGFQFQAVFIGEGRNEKDIMRYQQSLGMQSPMIFTGKISEIKILSWFYAHSQLFFFPSLYDNDPLVLKEAALHELPAIVLKNATIAQTIHHNQNGFVIESSIEEAVHKIIEIINDHALRIKVGKQAKQTLAILWHETLKDLVPSYLKVIQDYYSHD